MPAAADALPPAELPERCAVTAAFQEMRVMERFAWMTPERWARLSVGEQHLYLAYGRIRDAMEG